jgi:hypothetical protein
VVAPDDPDIAVGGRERTILRAIAIEVGHRAERRAGIESVAAAERFGASPSPMVAPASVNSSQVATCFITSRTRLSCRPM